MFPGRGKILKILLLYAFLYLFVNFWNKNVTLSEPIPQTGETHSSNSSATNHFVGLALKELTRKVGTKSCTYFIKCFLLKYVWPYFKIMYERVKLEIF